MTELPSPPELAKAPDDNPEIDRNSLRQLRGDIADDDVVDHFVSDFLELLDDRLRTLGRLLRLGRAEDAVTALLSIETSSLMVGANHLAATAAVLRRAVHTGDPRRLRQPYDELLAASERAKLMLAGH